MKERLLKILSEYNLNSSRLAEKMGIQRSGISHIMSGRNKPSYDFLINLLKIFPDIDANWLLTGKGSMYQYENGDNITDKTADNTKKINHQADLFSQIIPEKDKKTIKEKSEKPQGETNVYNSKRVDLEENVIESVFIFYKNGKFKSYDPG